MHILHTIWSIGLIYYQKLYRYVSEQSATYRQKGKVFQIWRSVLGPADYAYRMPFLIMF